jgi:hypothetical protein
VINIITNIDIANDRWNKAVTMSFLRVNPVTPKHWYMWPISDLFKYIKEFDEGVFQEKSVTDPEWEIFLWQQRKTAVLVIMFGFLRPGELAQISARRWEKIEHQGIFIEVEIKSHLGAKSHVFIPEIRDVSINPVYHMEMLAASTVALIPELKRQEDLEFLFTNPRSRERLTAYALSHAIHKVLVDAKLTPNNCYSVKSAAVSFLVSKYVPQEQIDQALHYRSGKSVMSKHYATLESLKVLPLLLAQSVDVLYSREMLRAPPTAEVSSPEEKPEERYETRLKYVINKRKDQLSKESEKRIREKRGNSSELIKQLDELNRQLENGGLSDSEASVTRTKKKLVWKRIKIKKIQDMILNLLVTQLVVRPHQMSSFNYLLYLQLQRRTILIKMIRVPSPRISPSSSSHGEI